MGRRYRWVQHREDHIRNQVYDNALVVHQPNVQEVLRGDSRIDPTTFLNDLKNSSDRSDFATLSTATSSSSFFSCILHR